MHGIFTSRKAWMVLVVVTGLAGVAWWQRQPILAWYYVRQLSYAYQENCEACAKRAVELDEAALPHLLAGLRNSDALVCGNMQYALVLMAQQWGLADPRSLRLVERLHDDFAAYSPAGREKVVILLTRMLQEEGPRPLAPRMSKAIGEVMVQAEKESELRAVALLLAAELVDSVAPGQWCDVCNAMVARGLDDGRAGTRMAALQLLRRAPMRKDREALERAVPLLRDADPAVRRTALLALASESEVVREEAFLPLLHDEDPQVQYLCEMALRKRGLKDDDLRLARMISDKNPDVRRKVVNYFVQMPELNLSAWLLQLSHDPEPAVRASAVRAAADYPLVDLGQRLQEMAERDPSETIRQNARTYLQQRAPRVAFD